MVGAVVGAGAVDEVEVVVEAGAVDEVEVGLAVEEEEEAEEVLVGVEEEEEVEGASNYNHFISVAVCTSASVYYNYLQNQSFYKKTI